MIEHHRIITFVFGVLPKMLTIVMTTPQDPNSVASPLNQFNEFIDVIQPALDTLSAELRTTVQEPLGR